MCVTHDIHINHMTSQCERHWVLIHVVLVTDSEFKREAALGIMRDMTSPQADTSSLSRVIRGDLQFAERLIAQAVMFSSWSRNACVVAGEIPRLCPRQLYNAACSVWREADLDVEDDRHCVSGARCS